MQNMVRTPSSPYIRRKKGKSTSWNRWTALTTVWFTRTHPVLTKTCLCVWQSSVRFAVTSRVASCTVWHVYVALRRMMRISSAVRTRWRMSSSVSWTLSPSCSNLWTSRTSRHRFPCVTRWTAKNTSVATRTGKKQNEPSSKLVKKRGWRQK